MIMQLQELKVAALAATPGPWGIDRAGDIIVSNQSHPVATVSDAFHRQLANGDVGKDAEFIAAANPDAILALLGELEASQCALKSVTELWNDQRQRIAELEAERVTPVRFPNEDTALAMFDIFYQTERNNYGNLALGYSDGKALGEWITAVLELRATGVKCEVGQ